MRIPGISNTSSIENKLIKSLVFLLAASKLAKCEPHTAHDAFNKSKTDNVDMRRLSLLGDVFGGEDLVDVETGYELSFGAARFLGDVHTNETGIVWSDLNPANFPANWKERRQQYLQKGFSGVSEKFTEGVTDQLLKRSDQHQSGSTDPTVLKGLTKEVTGGITDHLLNQGASKTSNTEDHQNLLQQLSKSIAEGALSADTESVKELFKRGANGLSEHLLYEVSNQPLDTRQSEIFQYAKGVTEGFFAAAAEESESEDISNAKWLAEEFLEGLATSKNVPFLAFLGTLSAEWTALKGFFVLMALLFATPGVNRLPKYVLGQLAYPLAKSGFEGMFDQTRTSFEKVLNDIKAEPSEQYTSFREICGSDEIYALTVRDRNDFIVKKKPDMYFKAFKESFLKGRGAIDTDIKELQEIPRNDFKHMNETQKSERLTLYWKHYIHDLKTRLNNDTGGLEALSGSTIHSVPTRTRDSIIPPPIPESPEITAGIKLADWINSIAAARPEYVEPLKKLVREGCALIGINMGTPRNAALIGYNAGRGTLGMGVHTGDTRSQNNT